MFAPSDSGGIVPVTKKFPTNLIHKKNLKARYRPFGTKEICLVKATKVVIEEIGNPVMDFSIYNPDKKVIHEFSKLELFAYANAMYLVSSIRYVFEVIVTVTQIDIAMFGVIATSIAGLISTWALISEKRFESFEELKH